MLLIYTAYLCMNNTKVFTNVIIIVIQNTNN